MVITLRSLQHVPPARRFDKSRRGCSLLWEANRRCSLLTRAQIENYFPRQGQRRLTAELVVNFYLSLFPIFHK